MRQERLIWIIFTVCAVTAIVLLNIFNPTEPADLYAEAVEASECEVLIPIEVDLISQEEQHEKYYDLRQPLDFSKKEDLGQGRYGFRKTLEVKETTILEQELWSGDESIYYGIYADPKLKTTLGRVSIKEQNRIHNALELGASLEDYPDD